MMTLKENESETFYKLFMSLLEYTNKKFKIDEDIPALRTPKDAEPSKLLPIRNKLWEDNTVIDEYIGDNTELLSDNEKQILSGWKKRISRNFTILKHKEQHTVFLDSEGDKSFLYGVIGIQYPLSKLIPALKLPLNASVVLLPFGDKIIYDGFILLSEVQFGGQALDGLNELCYEIEKNDGIITAL